MTHAEFLETLRGLGFEENGDAVTGRARRVGPRLKVDYDDDGRPSAITEDEGGTDREAELTIFAEPPEIDAEFHFAAVILGELDGEELVHIREEGPYHDHVFQNLHDEGLSTVEDLMEADEFDPSTLVAVYSEDAYEDVPKTTRIEWQPFFQNPVARSLQGLVDGLKKARS